MRRAQPGHAARRLVARMLGDIGRAKRADHGGNFPSVIRELRALRPGLRKLKQIVRQIDQRQGYDPVELQWLEIHERSLDEHTAALCRLRPDGEPLLEFSGFLRRPAGMTQRLTWRSEKLPIRFEYQ